MKRTKILYWSITGLFSAFMIFTAIPDIMKHPQAMEFIRRLGYPDYFVPFIGWAKVLGSIAILIPGFVKIKEWAYAGLFFDLIGALYSCVAVEGLQPQLAFLLLPMLLGAISYYLSGRLRPAINNN